MSQMPLSKIFLILFKVGSTFPFFIPVCLNNSWWCTRRHSWMLKTEEEFLFNLAPFSSRFVILACCHPLIIIFDGENPFHPPGDIQGYFQFDYQEPIISEDLFILSFQLSFSIFFRCIVQVMSSPPMISSFSCI